MFADADPALMEPRDFARLVTATPVDELRRVMGGPHRRTILDGIFVRMPTLFRADRAGTTEAVLHWSVGDRREGTVDTYEMVIAGGECVLSARPDREPRLTLTLSDIDFLKLVSSNANPVTMFVLGRMKAKGDRGLAMRIPTLFDIPKP
ncbi:SCP2 sterol-binding domain-containing protein [Micromonospora matsumotoense]|uniref:Putative sterol carrier protein n=2 Tax=Micromonospora matsumotoense TaxID=121616 RepID=A0A1C4X2I4_9ACTN|nr:Putative sterol carrier protein [Micromonospora matsumotoense]